MNTSMKHVLDCMMGEIIHTTELRINVASGYIPGPFVFDRSPVQICLNEVSEPTAP